MEPICYGCGKPGHIQANCPTNNKAKPHATAAVCVQTEDTETMDHVAPVNELREEEQPLEDENIKRDYLPLDEDKHPNETIRDDDDDDTGSSFRANALSTPEMGVL